MSGIWTMGEMLVEIMRPRAGMELYEPGEFLGPFPSGAPAIFISTVARLEHSGGIIGGVAEDDFGRCLLDRLRSDGVNVQYVEVFPNLATAVAFVTYSEDGSRRFIFHIDRTPAVMVGFPRDIDVETPAFFHVMGCSLMANARFRQEIFKAVEYFRADGARISFDPNIRPELLGDSDLVDVIGPVLESTSVLLPGETELRLLTGEEDPQRSADRLFGNPNLEVIVLKQGKEGATVFTPKGARRTPTYAVEEVDPTGAGDCFDAGFLCGLLEGRPLEDCGAMAAAAGALNAAAFGPMEGVISRQSIKRLMAG